MRCSTIYLRIDRQRISYLKFILEGYDGLGILSTVEPKDGLVKITLPPEGYIELITLLSTLDLKCHQQ
jgi:hypothetical protein